jgi:hypothetical protein
MLPEVLRFAVFLFSVGSLEVDDFGFSLQWERVAGVRVLVASPVVGDHSLQVMLLLVHQMFTSRLVPEVALI